MVSRMCTPIVAPISVPHLGAALSRGKICADRLTCPFHGIAFDAEGQCVRIPAIGRQGRIPKGMALRTFQLGEAHGLIWLWRLWRKFLESTWVNIENKVRFMQREPRSRFRAQFFHRRATLRVRTDIS
jgi:hypothetical protein